MIDSGAVRLQHVYKRFAYKQDPVLKNVSIDFPKEKLTYILGASGAGKSVLLKHILGLIKPDSGKVWIGDQDINLLKPGELSKVRLQFGMLFQDSALFDGWSVFDNVAFPLREHTGLSESEIAEKVHHTLSLLGMKSGWEKFPNELSGGMRKRVGLARAIVREPSILLYDEPTTGLDPVTRTRVDELIEKLKQESKLTSIVISHDISSALLLADQIAFLYHGEIVFFGVPAEFRESPHEGIRDFLEAERRMIDVFKV
jgi:phospholipid/cholesterol/gamma-HCH transport system ATP-binding protein